ncbi:MAG: acyl-CoA desaturase [Crocinitomicaceae bacterium]
MDIKSVKFSAQKKSDFVLTLNERVSNYFKENKISKYGNYRMYLKALFMFALYLTPYFFLVLGGFTNIWIIVGLYATMGVGMAGIGLSVMHDACHGTFSKIPWINTIMSYSMNMLGGNKDNWVLQHNVMHHTYTNVDGMDDDINAPEFLLRFSPHKKKYKAHRFQHIYAWFFYGFMTLVWCLPHRDIRQLWHYKKSGVINTQNKKYGQMLTELIIGKIFFFSYMLVVPMLVLDIPWWSTLLLFVMMQYISGFILSIIFQPAHVMEDAMYPLPKEDGKIENSMLEHQLHTTCNFAPKSRLFYWFVGGLNYQIEHHLFPHICHIHYKKLSKIVKETAQEFNLPYNSQPTFAKAIIEHGKMLKKLGRS